MPLDFNCQAVGPNELKADRQRGALEDYQVDGLLMKLPAPSGS